MSKDVSVREEPEWDERSDAILMRDVGVKPTTDIARELGVDPLAVRRRVSALLESVDVLTLAQQRQKLIIQLRELVSKANQRIENLGDRDLGPVVSAVNQTIKTQLGELARMEAQDNQRVTELNDLRVRELLSLISSVVETSVEEIAEKHRLDQSEMMGIFQARLVEAAEERDAEL